MLDPAGGAGVADARYALAVADGQFDVSGHGYLVADLWGDDPRCAVDRGECGVDHGDDFDRGGEAEIQVRE